MGEQSSIRLSWGRSFAGLSALLVCLTGSTATCALNAGCGPQTTLYVSSFGQEVGRGVVKSFLEREGWKV